MSGWSTPFAKRVLDSWATHSRDVGAEAVADRIRRNIKAKALQVASGSLASGTKKVRGAGSAKATHRAGAAARHD